MDLVEEEGETTLIEEEEVADTITLVVDNNTLVVDSNISHHRHLISLHKHLHISLLITFLLKVPLRASSMSVQVVRFMEDLDMDHWIVIIGWILLIKVKILP